MAKGQSWPSDIPQASDLFTLSAGFGLLAGLVEGASLLLLQRSQWAGENVDTLLVPAGILYVSPLTDMVLAVALAFLAAGICRLSRGLVSGKFILFLLFMMLTFDGLTLGLDRVMNPPYVAILAAGISMALLRRHWRDRARIVDAARRFLPALAGAVVLLFVGVQARDHRAAAAATASLPPARHSAPNVLLVVMDTVRADHVSALGYPRPTTPNLEHLAGQGVLFENAFSTSSWTLPAHASLLTGRYPFEHGAETKAYDGRYPTLSDAFLARGYRTGAFSANTYYFAQENGFGRGFLFFDGTFTNLADCVIRTLYGRNLMVLYELASRSDLPGRKRAARVNARFLSWLEQNPGQSFFAVLNYFDAHDPYLPPGLFRSRFAGRPDVGGELNGWGSRESLERPGDLQGEKDAYDGGIAYEDVEIGRLVEFLRQRGLAENTLLAVVADHGEFFGEHGLFLHKNALFMEGIHVPLLLVWPGHLPAGVRVSHPVSIASLPATLMALLPGAGEGKFPGPSLVPFWRDPKAAKGGALILSELVANERIVGGVAPVRTESLLSSRWHFIQTAGAAPQLFEWDRDPQEQRNLAATKEGQAVVAGMVSCLQDHRSQIRQPECGFTAGLFDHAPIPQAPVRASHTRETFSSGEGYAASLAADAPEPE